ncbi:MAG: efflux RND transporter periplasmic adaptor subunit [Acidobacteria bacterium]|nr:efflux RND transporter periplasmic adaptor subunit [Acidobacteriota bacterium]
MNTRPVGRVLIVLFTLFPMILQAQEMPPTPVRVTPAQQHSLKRTIELSGVVESRGSSVLASEIGGIVEELFAREGEQVRAGTPIVRLRSEDLRLRLESARAEFEEARARLDLAETSYERMKGLFDDQVASRQQLDNATSERAAWAGRVARTEAEVKRLERDLARTVVRAPFTAVVIEERVGVGEFVNAGGPVAEVIDVTNLDVTVEVPERYFAEISRGSAARVEIPSLGRFETGGSVRAIIPRTTSNARTFPVKVAISGGRIGIGMLATVHISLGQPKPSVIVPKDAIVRQGNAQTIFVVDDDNTVRRVPVTTSESTGSWIAVDGDVVPGDPVITRGNERIRPGQKVTPAILEYPAP